ncbi:MAG TPA: AMP-binding protein, partial [Terriglobales bacterium]|nr:AMP-binding protein [Terriglobales bacterium]
MERQSIGAFLDDFQRHGSEPAYVQRRGYRMERWTYGEVAQLAFQLARELESLGVVRGDRVLLWGENCAEWVAAFFACALTAVVAVPMDDAATPDFAERVCSETDAHLVICSSKHQPHIAGVPVLLLEELRDRVQAVSSAPYAPDGIDPSNPLEIIFTSGTTAAPKGVVISHANVLSNIAPLETEIRNYLKYERWVHPVRFLNLLPLSHVFGQFLGLFLPPLMAGTVVFQSALGPTEVIETIHRERVSVLVAVPRMLQSLKEKLERDLEAGRELDRFRTTFQTAKDQHFLRRWWTFRKVHRQFGWKFWAFISGGAALDSDTEEFWGRLGYAVIQGYGLTETTSLVSVNHPFRLGKGSIGKVLPGREVKLAEDGEILVRGKGVASGYWQDHHLASVSAEEGWYHTGDVGALDEQGNLYFKGRKKNVLVTPAGMNVYPEDLEAALRKHPEVRDCVVIGMEVGGNAEPCAVLILRDGSSADSVLQSTNDSLAEYQRMRQWFLWPESDFPRTTTGKPKVNVIADAVRAQREPRPSPIAGASPLAELVSKISGRRVEGLSPEADLENDLQLSSLERVELMSALEDRYQVDLKEASYSAAHTVGELEKILTTRSAGRAQYHYPRWTLSAPVRWLRTSAYYLLVLPAIRLLGWPRVEGRENLDGVGGPLLVISNHIDDVDVGFVQTALPARFRRFLATATGGEALEALRTPAPNRGFFPGLYDRLQWVLGVALLNLFPLPREAAFLRSFAYVGECIDRGYSVLVFPEGHHTTDGKLRPFRAGVGLLASRLNVPVLPMRIDGLFEVKQAGKRFAPPGQIRVRIGVPIRFEPTADPQWIARELQNRVAEL